MINREGTRKNQLSNRSLLRVSIGYGLVGIGMILNLAFLFQEDQLYHITTGLGILVIWAGVTTLQTPKTYFSVMSSLILAFSVVGFSDNLITEVDQPSNRDPKFVVHGLFCLAWMIAFAVQADLVRTGRRGLHKRVGIFGFVAAIGVTISTIYVFYAVWIPWSDMLDRVQLNRILLPGFVVLIGLAGVYRRHPDRHKRLILVGTLFLLGPILARAVGVFGPAKAILWHGAFLSVFVYDWIVLKRIHPVTYLGTAWFYLALGVVLTT